MATLGTWIPEYPAGICYPAEETNTLGPPTFPPTHIVLHSPEEEADAYFATPVWFSQFHPAQAGSTNAALSYHGFVFECVPPGIAPIANGVIGRPYPSGADPNVNLNRASRSIEIEGRAATIGQTMPQGSGQWIALVEWCAFQCRKHGLDTSRIIRHSDVANNRSDPGTLDMEALRADVEKELKGEAMDYLSKDEQIDLKNQVKDIYGKVYDLWNTRGTAGAAALSLTPADHEAIASKVADKLAERLKT